MTPGDVPRRPCACIPAQVVTDVLQDHRQQEDLEGECGQVVVEKECLLHHEEGEVVHCPAPGTQDSRQHPAQPAICGERSSPAISIFNWGRSVRLLCPSEALDYLSLCDR